MAQKQTKYSKVYHSSINKHIADKIEALEEEIKQMRDDAAKKFPFKPGERVAIMDADSRKFKYFAYFKCLDENVNSSGFFYIKYQVETKTGKKDKTIKIMFSNEFMVSPNEVDVNDKFEEIDLSKIKLKL